MWVITQLRSMVGVVLVGGVVFFCAAGGSSAVLEALELQPSVISSANIAATGKK